MAGEYLMTNLKRAEARRQAVLDWLNQHPGARMAEIEAALPQFECLHLRGSVASMVRLEEINADGHLKHRRLTALVTVTTSAEAMLAKKRLNSQKAHCRRVGKTLDQLHACNGRPPAASDHADEDEPNSLVVTISPGRTRYLSGYTKPAQGSRGQGAVLERNTINCHQLY